MLSRFLSASSFFAFFFAQSFLPEPKPRTGVFQLPQFGNTREPLLTQVFPRYMYTSIFTLLSHSSSISTVLLLSTCGLTLQPLNAGLLQLFEWQNFYSNDETRRYNCNGTEKHDFWNLTYVRLYQSVPAFSNLRTECNRKDKFVSFSLGLNNLKMFFGKFLYICTFGKYE